MILLRVILNFVDRLSVRVQCYVFTAPTLIIDTATLSGVEGVLDLRPQTYSAIHQSQIGIVPVLCLFTREKSGIESDSTLQRGKYMQSYEQVQMCRYSDSPQRALRKHTVACNMLSITASFHS